MYPMYNEIAFLQFRNLLNVYMYMKTRAFAITVLSKLFLIKINSYVFKCIVDVLYIVPVEPGRAQGMKGKVFGCRVYRWPQACYVSPQNTVRFHFCPSSVSAVDSLH